MTVIWLVFLLSFVKSFWGFGIGLLLVFLSLCAAQEDLYKITLILFSIGVVIVFFSVGG